MKVIGVDNFGRETVADELIQENMTLEDARKRVAELNKDADDYSPTWYRVVSDEYVLSRGMEDLV